jgi:hypothetical protein
MVRLRNEVEVQKRAADSEHKELQRLADQVEVNEMQQRIAEHAIDDQETFMIQTQLQLQNK